MIAWGEMGSIIITITARAIHSNKVFREQLRMARDASLPVLFIRARLIRPVRILREDVATRSRAE